MTTSTIPCASPGLSALVLYARPAERGRIVSCLIDQGLFVTEHDLAGQAVPLPPAALSAHMVVACISEVEGHRDLARQIVAAGASTIAVVPAGSPHGWISDLGLLAVVDGDGDLDTLRRAIQAAGQSVRARSTDDQVPPVDWRRVFGGLVFRSSQPWLRAGGEIASLSTTEHGVLSALVEAQGAMVSKIDLRRQLGSEAAPASDAYLKTVVLRIRRKVERLGGDSADLVSVRGIGYLLRS